MPILDVIDNHLHAVFFTALAASFAEYVLTAIAVRRFGFEVESNPVLRKVMENFGLSGLWIFWFLVWSFMVIVARHGRWFTLFLLVYCFHALINNLFFFFKIKSADE
ncbi:MAG: hypothetical protein ACK5SX_04955 [Sandaracinobacter sp.]